MKDDHYNAWFVKTNIKNNKKGILKGKKIAIKDNIAIADVPMSLGTKLMKGYKPKEDATVIIRLLKEGANIVGKSVSENMFVAGSSYTADTGPVNNPKMPGFSAGGSSSGSAALVASMQVDGALGCDQTGSIRIPCAWCGIYGLKPTRGLVPYTGIASVDQLLDTVGPIANKVSVLALILDTISGKDGLDGRQNWLKDKQKFDFFKSLDMNLKNKKIGVLQQGFQIRDLSEFQVDKAVHTNICYFKNFGVKIKKISIPEFKLGQIIADIINILGTYHQLFKNGGASFGTSTYYPFDLSQTIKERIKFENINELPPIVQAILYAGLQAENSECNYYELAQNMIPIVKKAFKKAFKRVDVLALPTVPFRTHKLFSELKNTTEKLINVASGVGTNCGIFNILGYPAINIPCKIRENHKPIGMMLISPFGKDQELLNFAYTFEKN